MTSPIDFWRCAEESAANRSPQKGESLRVLHLVNRVAETGNGISNLVVDLAIAQANVGIETHVATAGGDYETLLRANHVTVHRIDFTIRRPAPMLHALLRLRTLRRHLNPDVIHAHTIAATVLARLVTGTSRVVATVHNEWQRGVFLMASAHHLVGVSEAVSASMRRLGVPARKLSVVRNGVVGSHRRREAPRVSLEHPAIVSVGAISKRKGSDILLAAFQHVREGIPAAHLYFVGNGHAADIVELIDHPQYGKNVHMVGFDPSPERYLRDADVFVLASRKEPFGLALVEAMQEGVPCIGADTEGIHEILTEGSGILVRQSDPDGLAAAVLAVLSDTGLATSLAREGRRRSRYYSVAGMAQEYLRIYEASTLLR